MIKFLLCTVIASLTLATLIFFYKADQKKFLIHGTEYNIPIEYLVKSNSLWPFLNNANLDNDGPLFVFKFDNADLVKNIKGYNAYQDKGRRFPSILNVMVFYKVHTDFFSSKYYQEVVDLKGDFSNAKILKVEGIELYKLTPNVEGAMRWMYFTSDPSLQSPLDNKNQLILAECSSLIPKYNLAKCRLHYEVDGLVFQINISDVNMIYHNEIKNYLKRKFKSWKSQKE